MKNSFVYVLALAILLAACSSLNEKDFEEKTRFDEDDLVERVIFEAPVIRSLGDDDETRASLSQEGDGGIRFAWEATDTVGIYPDQGTQVAFAMTDGVGTNVASFDGGGWALRQKATYSCYYPLVGDFYLDRNAIPVSFANQEQTGVSNYNGVRFFLASEGTSSESSTLRFSFQMLNTVIRIKAIGLPAGTYTRLVLWTDEPVFVQEGTFGLEDMVITGKTYSKTLEIALKDFTLPEESTEANPVIIYLTSAPVDLSGKKVTVRLFSNDGSVYICEKTPSKAYEVGTWGGLKCVMEEQTTPAIPEAIDLGLPSGLKWASFNLGASAPEGYGDYYAWGDTEPYYSSQDPLIWKEGKETGYDWASYRWSMGNGNMMTKYCTNSSYGYNGFTDSKTVLDLEDDAANVNLGGNWRMPTNEEWKELLQNCTRARATVNGVGGCRFTSKINGNSVFFPNAGYGSGTRIVSGYSLYWSSSLNPDNPNNAWSVVFDYQLQELYVGSHAFSRGDGYSVRPVYGESVESVSLDKTEQKLIVGETTDLVATVLPTNATDKSVSWSSSNESVAIVSSTGLVTGVSAGSAIITVTTTDGGKTATCNVTVSETSVPVPEAVDMGLSVKWASFNLGASKPEEYGDYYAWGEIETKDHYNWDNYKWCMGSANSMTKYCFTSLYGYDGFSDNKTVLDPEDDAAHVTLGGNWRMPTDSDWMELISNCTSTRLEENGAMIGYKFTSNTNGNSIFFPLKNCWSSSLYLSDPPTARCMDINLGYVDRGLGSRYCDFSIRPVYAE